MKTFLYRLISSGLHPQLSEEMKVAIQVANADIILTIITLAFYSIDALTRNFSPLAIIHPIGLLFAVIGFLLIRFRHYDFGRFLIHFNGLAMIFLAADIYEKGSGYGFYYIVSVTIPFVTFTTSEFKKGFFLSVVGAVVLITQESLGTGFFFRTLPVPPNLRLESIIMVMVYLIVIFTIARWQLARSQKILAEKQLELVHQSGLIALGEMSGGIAHEINNPLQSIALQTEFLKRELNKKDGPGPRALEMVHSLEATGMRIAKMVKGLKDLSRDVAINSPEIFQVGKVIDDVIANFQERLIQKDISITVTGDLSLLIKGSHAQISQVLMNILNNSIDALDEAHDKWIRIKVVSSGSNIVLSIMDSGEIISEEIASKMMQPFFTTKEPGKGTGLGLSIASSIVGKHGGRLYYDSTSVYTSLIIELPISL